MTTRIREQLERLGDLKTKCRVTITTLPVELPAENLGGTLPGQSLEQQVHGVANCVTQMILSSRERRQVSAAKSAQV